MDRTRIRRLVITVAAIASSGATTLVFSIAAARTLSPTAFGDVAREFSVAMLVAQLTMAGISPALARHIGQGEDDEQRWSRARGGIRLLWVGSLACSLAYPALAVGGLAPVSIDSLFSGWAVTVIYPVYFGLKSFLFVLDRVETYAKLEFGSDALFYVLLVLLLTMAPELIVGCFAVAYGCFVVVVMSLITRRASVGTEVRADASLLRYAGYAMLSTYATVARFPAVIVAAGVISESAISGRVAAIFALLTPILLIPQAASVLTFATYARVRAPKEAQGLRATLRLTFAATMVPIVVGIIAAHLLLTLIYGTQFGPLSVSFGVLLLALGPVVVGMPIGNALAGAGEVRTTAAIALPGFFLTVALACIGGELYGGSGILIGCGLAIALTGVVLAVVATARLGLRFEDFTEGLLLMGVGAIALIQPSVAIVVGVIVVSCLVFRNIRTPEVTLP